MTRYIPTDTPAVLQMMAEWRRYEWQAALRLIRNDILSGQPPADLEVLRDGVVKILGEMDLVTAADIMDVDFLHGPHHQVCREMADFFRAAAYETAYPQ